MNVMIANQYFMMRKYLPASLEFEKVIQQNPADRKSFKKLIICYTQINKPENALKLFLKLISQDIEQIVQTDSVADDCPCPELIENIGSDFIRYEDEFTMYYVLGILWLYCDINTSLQYFNQAIQKNKMNSDIAYIIEHISNYLNNQKIKSFQTE